MCFRSRSSGGKSILNTGYPALLLIIGLIGSFTVFAERRIAGYTTWKQSPYVWFMPTWIVALLLLMLPIYEYPETFGFADALYVGTVHLAFSVGSLAAWAISAPARPGTPTSGLFGKRVVIALLATGILAQLLRTIDAQLSGDLSFFERLSVENLRVLKEQYADVDQQMTVLGGALGLVKLMAGAGQVGLIALSLSAFRRLPWAGWKSSTMQWGGALAALMAFNSWFTTGGRLGFAVTLLFLLLPWTLWPRKKHRKRLTFKKAALYAVGIAAALFFSTTFLSGRIGRTHPVAMLEASTRAVLNDPVETATDGSPVLQNMLLQMSYFSSTIPTLAFYMHETYVPERTHGNLNFSIYYRLFGRFIPGYDENAGFQAYKDLETPMVRRGYYPGVWGTMAREVLSDFGRRGTVLFFFVFGYVANWIRATFYRNPSLENGVMFTLIRTQIIFAGLHSLLYHAFFGYALMVSAGAMIAAAVVGFRAVRRAGSRATLRR